MERLEGWGMITSPEEGFEDGGDVKLLEDWREIKREGKQASKSGQARKPGWRKRFLKMR